MRFGTSRILCAAVFFAAALAACGGRNGGNVIPSAPASSNGAPKTANANRAESFSHILARKQLADEGAAIPDENVHLFITLAHRNQAELDQLIHDQETPGSRSYLHFLTPQDFDARFAASPQTKQRVEAVLRKAGFQIDPDEYGPSIVEADGTVAGAEALFSVSLHNVQQSDGTTAVMPVAPPTTPTALQSDVASILGLDTTELQPKPIIDTLPQTTTSCPQYVGPNIYCCYGCPTPGPRPTITPGPTPAPTPIPGSQYPTVGPDRPLSPPPGYYDDTTYGLYGYAPYTYAYDYDMPVQHGFAGSPQFAVGIIADANVSDGDLSAFYSDMNVNRTGNLFRVGTAGTSQDSIREVTLDVETVSALAPATNIYLYMSPQITPNTMTSAMNTAVQQNTVAVLSISYGGCEKQGWPALYEAASGEDTAASQASAEGITVIAASGDSGGPSNLSGCPSVMAPAASSYVVAIGGTSPDAPNGDTTTPGYPPEAYRPGNQFAWGQPAPGIGPPCAQNFCGTGGGASTHFQTAEQLNACGSGTTWRCVPDISLAADIYHRGFMVLNGQQTALAAGTSFATPMFAAIQAEIDERQGTRKGNVVGRLYSVWRTYGYSPFAPGQPAVFQDITAGNTGYQATAGYDWASGIGSLDGWALSSVE